MLRDIQTILVKINSHGSIVIIQIQYGQLKTLRDIQTILVKINNHGSIVLIQIQYYPQEPQI